MLQPLLATCLALALAGCGGSDDAPGGGGGDEPPATKANTVRMRNLQFEPPQLTVKAGDTVTWVNREGVEHNVVATGGADFESESFRQDGSFEFRTEEPGEIEYVCTLHPGMDATLTVE